MFVCVELETEDIQVWVEFDSTIAKEFGMASSIWGIDKDKKQIVSPLPNTLYRIQTNCEAVFVRDLLVERMKNLGIGFSVMVIDDSTWASDDWNGPTDLPKSKGITVTDEIESRDE